MNVRLPVLVTALVVLSACSGDPTPATPPVVDWGTASATAAPHSATATVVAYVAAVGEGRSSAARELLAPDTVIVDPTWLPGMVLTVGPEQFDSNASDNRPAYLMVQTVPITYDGPDGPSPWLFLVGETADHTWLILDSGLA